QILPVRYLGSVIAELITTMLNEVLLEAEARGRGRVLAPAVDLREAGAPIEDERGILVDAGFEHEAPHAHLPGGRLEAVEHGAADSLAPLIGFDVHPLRLG